MQYKKITYIQYTNPAAYPPLQHSSRIFAKAGWKVLFLGTGSRGESNSFEFPPHENIIVKRWKYYNPGLVQKLHYIFFSFWSAFISWWSGSSWVYASDMIACPAAILARNIFGIKIIYHEHDSPNGDSQKETLFIKFLLRCRKYLAQKAEIVIFPNADRAKLYQEETGRIGPIEIVWNVPSMDELRFFKTNKPSHPVLFYHGSLNEARLPTSVLDALKLLDSNVSLVFAGYSTGISYDYGQWYLDEAKKRGLDNRVRYLGSLVDRVLLLAECSKASIGLAFMPKTTNDINMKHMVGASNKPFDYLICGLDVIITDRPEWNDFYVTRGLAISCNPDNKFSIVDAIEKYTCGGPEKLGRGKKVLDLLNSEWNYEFQFRDVYNKVNY